MDSLNAERIRQADASFFAALVAQDSAALDALLADDFVIVEVGSGLLHPRADFLRAVRDGVVVFEMIDTDPNETLVREYGAVAIAIGRTAMTIAAPDGSTIQAASRYTHVFVTDGESCRLVSAQGTPIAQ